MKFPPLPAVLLAFALHCAGQGSEVVVVFNSQVPESEQVADYYAQRRSVPTNQILGLDLPTGEAMTRQEFVEKLQKPLARFLEAQKLLVFGPATNRFPDLVGEQKQFALVANARVRYAVLCYGVPVKILRDPKLIEPRAEKFPAELRRNEAAVDTQLSCLFDWAGVFPWTGPVANPSYGVTNLAAFHPTNGLLLVTRLDGPSASIARGLVDKAIDAETNGLWGRAYIDARGITNGGYAIGDEWMRLTAAVSARAGLETVYDDKPGTFPAGYPMSHIAVYAGWYDQQVSGPFTRPSVEFMPGAFAYHLYSFSAQTIRTPGQGWTAVLLEKGATCTMGMVDEPYLQYTPNIAICAERLLGGYSFGEAAYASLTALSWQTTFIGDPLYRPATRSREALAAELQQRGSPLADWTHIQAANRKVATGNPASLAVKALEEVRRRGASLTEKLGDIYLAQTNIADAIDMYEAALQRGPSPMQRLRLLLSLAERQTLLGPDDKALGWYEMILKEHPDFPEPWRLCAQMLPIAKRLGRATVVERCEKEIARHQAAAANANKGP